MPSGAFSLGGQDAQEDSPSALSNLGAALGNVRRFEDEIAACQDAVAAFRETGDRYGAGTAPNNLGGALQGVWQPDRAAACWQGAAAAMHEARDQEEAAHLEQLAANAKTGQRPRWRRTSRLAD